MPMFHQYILLEDTWITEYQEQGTALQQCKIHFYQYCELILL